MDENKLEEYKRKQVKKLNESAKRLANKGPILSMKDFFPELTDKKVYSNFIQGVGILDQIPYYDQIILPLWSYVDESAFHRGYGLGVDEICSLIEEGRLLVYIGEPSQYAGLDYLDPILEKEPPLLSNLAIAFFKKIADAVKGPEYYMACYDVALEKLVNLRNEFDRIIDIESPVMKPFAFKREDIVRIFADCYAILCTFGYEKLAAMLLTKGYLAAMKEYAELLVIYPRFYSLDGVVGLTKEKVNRARELGIKIDAEVFPADIGSMLNKELKLALIENYGSENIDEVCDATEPARTALFKLDKALRNECIKDISEEKNKLEELFRQAREQAEEISSRKRWSKIIINESIGIIGGGLIGGPIGSFVGGLSGFLTEALPELKIPLTPIEKFSEKIAKWGKPAHVIAFYDLGERAKQEKERAKQTNGFRQRGYPKTYNGA